MPEIELRKRLLIVEEIFHEGGPVAAVPLRRAAAISVIANPFAGRYVEEISPFMKTLEPLGVEMAQALVGRSAAMRRWCRAMARAPSSALQASWSTARSGMCRAATPCARCSATLRQSLPSAKKVGGPGTRLDVPVTHINASYVRSHFDAMEVGVPDGPRADEMALALVMTTGARVHARVGGLAAADIRGEDGLR